jgi:hypothetical protein
VDDSWRGVLREDNHYHLFNFLSCISTSLSLVKFLQKILIIAIHCFIGKPLILVIFEPPNSINIHARPHLTARVFRYLRLSLFLEKNNFQRGRPTFNHFFLLLKKFPSSIYDNWNRLLGGWHNELDHIINLHVKRNESFSFIRPKLGISKLVSGNGCYFK